MATIVPDDPADEGDEGRWPHYPWSVWASHPYPTVVAAEGEDFTLPIERFDKTLRTKAYRLGLKVKTKYDKSYNGDRIMFKFYQPEGRQPILPSFPPRPEDDPTHGSSTFCRVCGTALVEGFLPHDVLGECIYKNTDDRRDSSVYLTHRLDDSNAIGLRQIMMIQLVENAVDITEDGPVVQT